MRKTFAELGFPGRLIAVEGLDGSGKSTQVHLLQRWLELQELKVFFSEWNSSEGAGDTFAGGFMGYLAAQNDINDETMRRAMIYGSVMASFNVEKFGTERVDALDYPEINDRFKAFKKMTHFDDIPFERANVA